MLGGVNSDGSSSSDLSAGVATSPVGGLSGYSPFMGVPWGNTVPAYLSEPPAGPLEMPSSPMSPGALRGGVLLQLAVRHIDALCPAGL